MKFKRLFFTILTNIILSYVSLSAQDVQPDIALKVKTIVADILNVERTSIADTASFTKDLGASLIDNIMLIMKIERVFGISVPENRAISTVEDAVVFIEAEKPSAEMIKYPDEPIFRNPEQMPEFPGGPAELFKYLSKNVKMLVTHSDYHIMGRVIISFIVEKDGSISNAKITRPLEPYCDGEAMRVVKAMPKWIPGRNKGQEVAVIYTIPITFRSLY